MTQAFIIGIVLQESQLEVLEHDLNVHYGDEYRIICTTSLPTALRHLQSFKEKKLPLALVLVDNDLMDVDLINLLETTQTLYPGTPAVLLTPFDQVESAISRLHLTGLESYIVRPWVNAEMGLYPQVDDLLSKWSFKTRLPVDHILLVGSRWDPGTYALKEFMSRNQIPYTWMDIDQEQAFQQKLTLWIREDLKYPIVIFPDHSVLINPNFAQLAEKVGIQTIAELPFYDLIIIGAGPAGLANAVYGGSEGLRTLLIEQSAPGGQAGTSSRIENYLGFPAGITGDDLAQRASAQAKRFGAEILTAQKVIRVERHDPYRAVVLEDGTHIMGYVIMIASGMAVKKLDIPGMEKFLGRSIYYGAAMTEANLYRNQDICVVGGANSAGQGALYFARFARRVYIIIRAASLEPGMSNYLAERIIQLNNAEIITESEVKGIKGTNKLEEVILQCRGEEKVLSASAMFIFIGSTPHSDMVRDLVQIDDRGFILTGLDITKKTGNQMAWPLQRDPLMFETSVPGIFAAGDVRAGANRRVAAAVGEGSASIYLIHKYLEMV